MLKEISSPANAKVKLLRKLASRKGRWEEKLFIAEGINLVTELIALGQEMEFLMLSEAFNPCLDERRAALAGYIETCKSDAYIVKDSIFNKLSDAEHGVDVMAVCRMRQHGTELIEQIPQNSCLLVCDRVQDPGNIGTMIRTAVAAGYGALVIMPGTADIYSPKVLRATAGAVFNIPIVYARSEDELFDIIQKTSRRMVVTDPAGGSAYYEEDLSCGIALVIGNEGAGVSDNIMKRADVRVTLPMRGSIESLNAAVAAAVLMYEAIRS